MNLFGLLAIIALVIGAIRIVDNVLASRKEKSD